MTPAMQRFQGKVAVITGAGRGIGAATARQLAAEGAKVVIADLNGPGGEAVARQIVDAGGAAVAVRTDVGEQADVEAMIQAAVDRFGGLDVLVNNAALLAHPEDLGMVTTPQPLWEQMYNVNVFGIVRACRLAIPLMIARGGGAILNISSAAAIQGEPIRNAYGSSKVAVIGLTRNIAAGHAREGIRCNAIVPGLILSEAVMSMMDEFAQVARNNPMGRLGRPEEIAEAIAFLCSDQASYITGQVLAVDGGVTTLRNRPNPDE
jgi:NAD(P)-dependent dehydrogenase (short-subunit alcohol dehydrogenase family)